MTGGWKNKLYYGDNLDILRRYIPDESVDLIYLDPPFNSNATYNVLFAEQNGTASAAQIRAFEDTWHWDRAAEQAYREVVEQGPKKAADLLQALRQFLGQNDVMAYLAMMAVRLIELRRVRKPTGSIYLHRDPTASHYLKLVMDSIFGARNFRNEIIWHYKFRLMHNKYRFNRKHDVLVFYAKSDAHVLNRVAEPCTREEVIRIRKQAVYMDEEGREWIWMLGPRGRSKNKKKYIDDIIQEGKALSDVWDIMPITSSAKERLGYPTQKPETLLERIIRASSNEGDIIFDPFCGCGTAVAVPERLRRRWIGIDITHLAINLIKRRLQDTFGDQLSPYEVIGEPVDLKGAQALAASDPFQFQCWALGLVGARPVEVKKGPDRGVDGYIYFHDEPRGSSLGPTKKIIVQVRGGKVGVKDVRELVGVVEREKAVIGALLTLARPTRDMAAEAAASGFYQGPLSGAKHPGIQLITIAEALQSKKIDYPPALVRADATFKRAVRRRKKDGQAVFEFRGGPGGAE